MSPNVSTMKMKRGGTKRKIEIKKRETKQQRSVACSKRRVTLFSKAADICLNSGADITAFVTSPANSELVYSFSGFSSASEMADCYLNGKSPPKIINPQSKLGFWWDDPDLYRNCDDLSELNLIEERMMKVGKHMMDCIEKKGKPEFGQNPNFCSLDQNTTFSSLDQNPNFSSPSYSSQITFCDQSYGGSSSEFVSYSDPKPNSTSPSSIKVASFEDKSFSSIEKICGKPSSQVTCNDQNLSFCVEDFNGESSSDQSRYLVNEDPGFVDSFLATDQKVNNGMSLSQETQTQPITDEDQSFWENLFQVPLLDHSYTNEEDDELMIDISDFVNDEEIQWPQF